MSGIQTDRKNTEDILDAQDRQKKRQDRQISRHTDEGQTGKIEKQTDGRVGLTNRHSDTGSLTIGEGLVPLTSL